MVYGGVYFSLSPEAAGNTRQTFQLACHTCNDSLTVICILATSYATSLRFLFQIVTFLGFVRFGKWSVWYKTFLTRDIRSCLLCFLNNSIRVSELFKKEFGVLFLYIRCYCFVSYFIPFFLCLSFFSFFSKHIELYFFK